ncbi:hypothetical protein [Aureitalea marina]|nr:hypothetical protein [Aureitalea marina]
MTRNNRNFLLVFLITIFGQHLTGQNLYYIHENVEKSYKKEGRYYPDHTVKIKDGDVYSSGKLMFQPPLKQIYDHFFEIFEDEDEKQFVVVTQVFKDQNDFASVYTVIRELLYLVDLSEEGQVFVTKMHNGIWSYNNGLMLSTQESFDFYAGGNRIKKIDTEQKKIVILRQHEDGEVYEQAFDIYKY